MRVRAQMPKTRRKVDTEDKSTLQEDY